MQRAEKADRAAAEQAERAESEQVATQLAAAEVARLQSESRAQCDAEMQRAKEERHRAEELAARAVRESERAALVAAAAEVEQGRAADARLRAEVLIEQASLSVALGPYTFRRGARGVGRGA
jgi:hypothetical protein